MVWFGRKLGVGALRSYSLRARLNGISGRRKEESIYITTRIRLELAGLIRGNGMEGQASAKELKFCFWFGCWFGMVDEELHHIAASSQLGGVDFCMRQQRNGEFRGLRSCLGMGRTLLG